MSFKSRAELFGEYIIENNSTIRKTAKYFDVSKSTVHNDLSKKLRIENYELYLKVNKILKNNFETKHIRGGIATKSKYQLKSKRWLKFSHLFSCK